MQDFFNIEQTKEEKIFKEIDFQENQDLFEPTFEFSIQDLHSLYKDFLQLSPGMAEEAEEKIEE